MAILEAGALASHFTLLGLDGREYSVPRSLDGKPALLVFFKTSCATCDLTFPYLNALRDAYTRGWSLWAISQDAPDRSAEYGRRFGVDYPVLIDAPEYSASRLYDPPATPTLFLVSPDGRVDYTTHGFAKDDLNEISNRIAGRLGVGAVVIAPEKDGNPPFKPG
jgi:peroxiredoxin